MRIVLGRRRRTPGDRAGRTRGQGLVEFALALPVLLLILLIAVDAGRLFYGYIELHNATRIAANYAANHPDDWPAGTPSGNPAEYDTEISRDTNGLECTASVFAPTFVPATSPRNPGAGHTASVTLTCAFVPMTPFISSLVGTMTLKATNTFPIKAGMLANTPLTPGLPTPTPAPTPSPTPAPTPAPTPSPTPDPSAAPTPTPLPNGSCRVPQLLGLTTDQAKTAWAAAGFAPAKLQVAIGPSGYLVAREWTVQGQTQTFGTFDLTVQNCNSFALNIGPAS